MFIIWCIVENIFPNIVGAILEILLSDNKLFIFILFLLE